MSYRRRVQDLLPLMLTQRESESIINNLDSGEIIDRAAYNRAVYKLGRQPVWRADDHPRSKADERKSRARNRRRAKVKP